MAVTLEQAPWLGWVLVKALMRFAFMVANNLVAISSYVFYVIVLQPLRVLDSKSFWYIEGIMYKWLLGMVASWGWYAGYTGKRASIFLFMYVMFCLVQEPWFNICLYVGLPMFLCFDDWKINRKQF